MKNTFTAKIRIVILVLFSISLIQGLIILNRISNVDNLNSLMIDIQNTIILTIFLQFIVVISFIYYIPIFLNKTFSEIHSILKDITRGIYSIEIDLDDYQKRVDKEFFAVILSIKEMLKSVQTFDALKKEKIIEHHSRIISILHLTENGFIITDTNGNIVFINDKVTEAFKSLTEATNILETNFPPEVENSIKKYLSNILKSQTKQESQQFFVPALKRHVGLNSAVVRGPNGGMKGAIISISNLEKKKLEKKEKVQE